MSLNLRHSTGRRSSRDEQNVLPLINVVFLLLIFFMLTGTLAASDPFQIAPPQSASEGASGSRDMMILVGVDGRLALDGEVMTDDELLAAVAERLAEDDSLRTQLKADQLAEAVLVVQVMEQLRDAGVDRLQLLTIPEAR